MLEMWCAANSVPLRPVDVGQVKKHWTDKGNAEKLAMVETAGVNGFHPTDHNQTNAVAILTMAQHIEGVNVPVQEVA